MLLQTPTTTESETKELFFDSYVTLIHTQHCACGETEHYSQCYEVWLHPTKTRSSNLRDLRPLVGPLDTAKPMAHVARPARMIPVCCFCISAYKAEGNTIAPINPMQWQETLLRKALAAAQPEVRVAKSPTAPAPTKPKRMIPTLDQI